MAQGGGYAVFHAVMRAKAGFSARARTRRMARFATAMGLRGGERVIDLGGTPGFWAGLETPLDITVLNLPGSVVQHDGRGPHRFTLVEGDGCAVDWPDGAFDIAVSNSVIEHVGPPDRQQALAGEVRRLAPRYWVQTPSVWFPVEAHTNMPFWWAYPAPLREAFLRRWRRRLPKWCEMVEGTTVIARSEMVRMFPDARIWTERWAGLPKSYVAWRG